MKLINAESASASPCPSIIDRLVVINDVASAQGGATGLALQSIRLIRGLGIPVTLIVGDVGENAEMEALGVSIVGLGGRHVAGAGPLNAIARGIYNRPARKALAAWIATNDSARTIYHVHGWSKILSPSIFGALKCVAPRTVLHAHDFFLACPNGAFQDYQRNEPCYRVPLGRACLATNCDKRSYPQKLWRAARQQALSLVAGANFETTPIAMIHGGMRPWFERSGFAPERLRTILNPVEAFSTTRVEAESNAVFYFIGRVEAEKGVFEAAEAARRAGTTLRVIGDGADRVELERCYPEVEIRGWSNRQTIGRMLIDARAVVMPSRYPEPFGLVAAEASRSGVPVVMSSHALLAPEFEASGLGLVCDTRDPDRFARTLRQFADMPAAHVRAMSMRAFAGNIPIANSLAGWRDDLLGLYRELSMKQPQDPSVEGGLLGLSHPKVRLFNVKYSPNLGDGLLSEALEQALHECGCDRIETYSVDMAARTRYGRGRLSRSLLLRTLHSVPPVIRRTAVRLPLAIARRHRWNPHYEARLNGAHAVVIGGGNLFTDIDLNFPSKMATVMQLAARHRLPVAIYGVGVSSKWSSTGLAIMRQALHDSDLCYVSVRDHDSKRSFDRLFAEAAGREAEIVRDPGILVSRYLPPREDIDVAEPIGLCITSALTIRYHSPFRTSDSELADWYGNLCKRLAASGRPIVAFTNGSPEDEAFLNMIEASLDRSASNGFQRWRPSTPEKLARLISGLALLVAHRMHALIAGYSYGVPIFALRWDGKVDAFMESVGAEKRIAFAMSGNEDQVAADALSLLSPAFEDEEKQHSAILSQAIEDVAAMKAALDVAIADRSSKKSLNVAAA